MLSKKVYPRCSSDASMLVRENDYTIRGINGPLLPQPYIILDDNVKMITRINFFNDLSCILIL